MKNILFKILVFLFTGILLSNYVLADTSHLKGKILLQVEENGEAWYVNPADEKRYFMGRPENAFNLMRELGVGISNDDISKIIIAKSSFSGVYDGDGDGLSKMIEDSLGTSDTNNDTDGDGYLDKTEVMNGYNPNGVGKLEIDNDFANKQAGKILLQVERNGEAWYVNPNDEMRYFLGRPSDAFNLMRRLGLGITNNDLDKILVDSSTKNSQTNSETSKEAVNTDDLFFCKLDEDCIITDSRYPNGCFYMTGGCDLRSYNKNVLNNLKNKINNNPSICDEAHNTSQAYCIPDALIRPICQEHKCEAKEITSQEECNYSWSSSMCVEQFNENNEEITVPEDEIFSDNETECELFPENLESCNEYQCIFNHPLTGDMLIRDIAGIEDGKCVYIEEMPNDGEMECRYTESERKVAADYYNKVLSGGSFSSEDDNPLQDFLDNGQCVIYGYEISEEEENNENNLQSISNELFELSIGGIVSDDVVFNKQFTHPDEIYVTFESCDDVELTCERIWALESDVKKFNIDTYSDVGNYYTVSGKVVDLGHSNNNYRELGVVDYHNMKLIEIVNIEK